MLTEGIYQAVVVSQSWTRSQPGNVGLQVTVKLIGELVENEVLTGTIWFTDKAINGARHQLKNLGVDIDAVALKAVNVKDAKCRVTVKSEEWQGVQQLKIGFFLPFEETPPEAELDGIEKQLRAAKSKPKVTKTAPLPTDAPSPDDDGSIPF